MGHALLIAAAALAVLLVPVTSVAAGAPKEVDHREATGDYVWVSVGGFAFYPKRIYVDFSASPELRLEGNYSVSCKRKRDQAFRLDGDEFAVLTPFRLGIPIPLKLARHCRVGLFVESAASGFPMGLAATLYSIKR